MTYNIEPVFQKKAEHGEGPLWDSASQNFYWVDLLQGYYFKGNPYTELVQQFSIGEPLGVMALTQKEQSVMATANGFGIFDEEKKQFSLFDPSPESDRPELRFNDGTVDPRGRFLAGSMTYDGGQPVGRLYRLNEDTSFTELDNGFNIPNGMGWNKSGETFYMIDTLQFKMFAYDYDLETGNISNKRVFMTFEKEELADGMTIDTEGCFWIAFYGKGKIVKYDPTGKKIVTVDVPAPYTTSCCFGGENLNLLFITTSYRDLDGKGKSNYPLSGRCFMVETESVGIPDPRVKLL